MLPQRPSIIIEEEFGCFEGTPRKWKSAETCLLECRVSSRSYSEQVSRSANPSVASHKCGSFVFRGVLDVSKSCNNIFECKEA